MGGGTIARWEELRWYLAVSFVSVTREERASRCGAADVSTYDESGTVRTCWILSVRKINDSHSRFESTNQS